MLFPVLLAALLAYASANPLARASCGSCHATKDGFVNVHLIPHTHDDVGWLKTVDQYFYGKKNEIQVAAVQHIIDSVVEELAKKPQRRFIYVETAFMKQWWDMQDEAIRSKVRGLIERGQLELISGAWSMHDEAVTHYQSIIDQFTWGMKTIDDMFGLSCAKPHIGWQIDPFGHSRETASILAQLGFDGLFFARLHKDDRADRIENKKMEFVWEASSSLGNASRLFTSAFYSHYSAPSGFCFDLQHCRDEPIIDNPNSPDYNVPKRVGDFLAFVESRKDTYVTDHLLVTMGDDFTYQQAASWFDNIDLLIKYVNAEQENGSKVNLLYSTPSCYLNAVHRADKVWTTKQDDFFPYADGDHSYWTGYYTSRPTQKFMERKGNNFLQVSKQLSVLADLREEKWEDLSSLREAMGVMQHHDAITGTEKQHVADDYARLLHQGMLHSQETAQAALNKLVTKYGAEVPQLSFHSCLLSNISQCEFSESSDNLVVTLYNPLAQEATNFVRLPVQNFKYRVFHNGTEVTETQMLKIPTAVTSLPFRNSTAEQELIFRATIPPLGFISFYVSRTSEESPVPTPLADDQKFRLTSNKLEVTFDPATGLLASVFLVEENRNFTDLTQKFFYYKSKTGDIVSSQNSGAYIFRPDGDDPIPVSDQAELESFSGSLVQETHQRVSDWVTQVVRLYADTEFVEFEWMVGNIPRDETPDPIGKEVITRYSLTPLETNGVFFTDSNGREILQRTRKTTDITEPVAGNYYPVTTSISTRDDTTEFGILVDRAQGGTSLQDGVLELMVHRRLVLDDSRGVGEPLNEEQYEAGGLVARGKHLMYLAPLSGSPTPVAKQRRWSRDNMVLYPWTFFTETDLSEEQWLESYNVTFTGLQRKVADNINILTLEPWNKGEEILVRYEHFFEKNDDPELSVETDVATINLIQRFGFEKDILETTLGGNKWVSDSSRLQFKVESTSIVQEEVVEPEATCGGPERACVLKVNITMKPMQIRTFIVKNGSEGVRAPVLLLLAAALVKILLN